MDLSVDIFGVQHVKVMRFSMDLRKNKLTCIVGKNGVGKTTLIKSISNIRSADAFKKTSPDIIFNRKSKIIYTLNDKKYKFYYDSAIRSLNSKKVISDDLKKLFDVELPIPFGQRFNFFQSISDADLDIRRAIVLEQYNKPAELITFLNEIYSTNKFDNLIQISIKGVNYYCILMDGNRYIREDYLSSGEFFLISLYRKIKGHCKLIVIDEIDISLDTATQSHLIKKLRDFCIAYQVNILFTTHSLAMMRTLEEGELFYMQEIDSEIKSMPASYNYIRSVLFGFKGWDKYILTEDFMLKKFIEFVISKYCDDIYYEYKIIYIGGGENVTDLMERNAREEFFSKSENVISVLDGDQKNCRHARNGSVYCIPLESVEKAALQEYRSRNLIIKPFGDDVREGSKAFFKRLMKDKIMSESQIFNHLCQKYEADVRVFAKNISVFLSARLEIET